VLSSAGAAVSPSSTPTATVAGSVTLNGRPFNGGNVPFGSLVDVARGGKITLTTGVGTLQVTRVSPLVPATFVLRFTYVNGKPYVRLELAKGNFNVCPKGKRKTYGVTATAKTIVRALWGKGRGNFQTHGRFAAATVRGTSWQTDDRCDGTWLRVFTGLVAMTNLKTGATTLVRAGQTHLIFG
jgi:hypothetical protein